MRAALIIALTSGVLVLAALAPSQNKPAPPKYETKVLPLMKKYCFACHSGPKPADNIDFSRFKTDAQARKAARLWKKADTELKAKAMPPKGSPMPTAAEVKTIRDWIASVTN